MDSSAVASIIGWILFGISEILPFISIPTSGMFHTFILGLDRAFTSLPGDIEMATQLVPKGNYASIINTLSNNPQIKTIFDKLLSNPEDANNITLIQNNTGNYANIINVLNNNPQIKTILDNLLKHPEDANNITLIQNNVELSSFITMSAGNPAFKIGIEAILSDPTLILKVLEK